jgi:hypothetical protein
MVKDKAYIAGIVDGEGCISIHRRSDRCYKQGYSFYATLRVSNTNKPLLDWLKRVTGLGAVVENKVVGNRRPQWEWKVHSQQAGLLLKELYSFLRVKKKQARLVLQFVEFKNKSNPIFKRLGTRGMPLKLWKRQESMYLQARKLNARGLQ